MSTTILKEFSGKPTLTPEKVTNIKEWYASLQGDCDKADTVTDSEYYQGGVDMAVNILELLYEKESKKCSLGSFAGFAVSCIAAVSAHSRTLFGIRPR
jgi:hypothetical protein